MGARTGCDRLRAAAARYSLCGRCVVDAVPTSTTTLEFSFAKSWTIDLFLIILGSRQPAATHGNGFGFFRPFSVRRNCHRLPPVATARLR